MTKRARRPRNRVDLLGATALLALARAARGGFGSVEDLIQTAGIGPAKWERLAPWVRVRGEALHTDGGAARQGE